ncbi:hypothetical protein AVEN_240099-1 [Araneus ventricosus]|uniref:Uncharacterized protein n=1 Tax=Araneus ventricosus TaxID=182803 RepID=A0A4Y2NG76_ARAVE|nr:hypothetical protein AVEN_240099-1 [Araneus ventricosus]
MFAKVVWCGQPLLGYSLGTSSVLGDHCHLFGHKLNAYPHIRRSCNLTCCFRMKFNAHEFCKKSAFSRRFLLLGSSVSNPRIRLATLSVRLIVL